MRSVSARKTEISKLDLEQASEFVATHHRQGLARIGSAARAYGLYLDDELLAVAIFCNPRTRGMQKQFTTELFRMAFKSGVRVRGGASKLIKHFMRSGAIDLFTYQDLSGESTDVYSHSGMSMISEQLSKDVLVLDGKTAKTASDNRRDWFSIEQAVRFGPDSLLGTSFGEVFVDGRRRSNIELFQDAGYHIEKVPGDRIYGWRNPDVRFYTYRVSSTESPGYYLGRKIYRDPELTESDLLLDGYFGSGGRKFQQWLSSVHPDSLVKEVTGIYPDWPTAISAEYAVIGDRYKDDPNCMNQQPGGMGLGASVANMRIGSCPIHGESIHNGKSCMKCGSSKIFVLGLCEVHGETLFRKDVCAKCSQVNRYSRAHCKDHGETSHRDGRCLNCISSSSVSIRNCEAHGYTKHIGEICSTCNALSGVSSKICPIHGETKFRGDTCSTCSALSVISLKDCPVHGETKHSGDHCMKCNSAAQYSMQTCSTHGEVKHKGGSCTFCTAAKAISMAECPIHGLTKHQGTVCNRCNAQSAISQRECPKHGLTTHQGAVCSRCNAERSVSEELCEEHGLSKFQGGVCVRCRSKSMISERECDEHGLSKHRGSTCMKCAQAKRRKPEDVLAEAGMSEEDVRKASLAGETLASISRKFGISKHHVKRILGS